jgi:hypothetical protein
LGILNTNFLSDFTFRPHAAVLVDRTRPTCSDLNFNADQLQQLEATRGIVLMLSNLFFRSRCCRGFDLRICIGADGHGLRRRPGR